jgi:hypothetical protein
MAAEERGTRRRTITAATASEFNLGDFAKKFKHF